MGKNKSKKCERTEYARWESIMAKLDNQIAKERAEEAKKRTNKEEKGNAE